MSAKDRIHNAVKNALIKEGWDIVADPYPIQYKEVRLLADLAGEKGIAATKEEQKVVIEVKSFVGRSPMREFQTALGQYLIYRTFIEQTHADYKIYLAVNQDIYDQFFQQIAIQLILTTYQVLLLIVDLNTEEVRRWID